MTDNPNTTNIKLVKAMGAMNIALGAVLFVDGVLIVIMAFCCLLMSFSLFFLAAIPAFLVTSSLSVAAFIAAAENIAAGLGAVLSAKKGGNVSKGFTIATLIIDILIIPANVLALICGSYLLYTEVNFLSVLIFIIAASVIALAVASLTLSIIRLKRKEQ